MRLLRTTFLIAAISAARSVLAMAQRRLEAEIFLGSAVSLPLPMTIGQRGERPLRFTARWATRPTAPARYYAWRVGVWQGARGWQLDHTHHKLYLTNPPPEVQLLWITNGFNIFSISRAFRSGRSRYSVGAGPVVTYAYSEVRNQAITRDNGLARYRLSGGSLLAMATRELPLTSRLRLSIDTKVSTAFVRVPVVGGRASVPNVALHFGLGVGYRLGGPVGR